MLRLLTHACARLLPRDLRDAHGEEIARDIDRRFRERARLSTFADVAATVVRERRATRSGPRPPFRRTSIMTSLLQDTRFAVRLLRRSPWFSGAIVLILAIGIGSATAIVSLAQATLLRPIAVADPGRLVEVRTSMSYPRFRDLQKATDIADAVFAYANVAGISFNRGGVTRRVPAAFVSGNYFDALGLRPAAGRLLSTADEAPGGVPAVVISHRLWSSAFNRDTRVLGETVLVNRRPVVIVGVAPAGFKGLSLANVGDVWMPAAFTPDLATGFIARPEALKDGMTWLRAIVRLKPGVTPDQAAARLTALDAALRPASNGAREPLAVDPIAAAVVTRNARGDLRTFVTLLVAVAGVLLLLGCSNVANLLLARGAARRQELGVRTALGAGRGRLIRQLLIESLVLAVIGGAGGVLVAAGALRAIGQYRLPGDIPIADLGLGIDGVTLATSAVLALAAAAIFGPLPAWLATRKDARAALHDGSRGATRLPLGRVLVAAQIALCVTLVGGGLLFARGLQRALSLDLGYEPSNVAMTTADPGLERLKPEAVDTYIDTTLARLRADPSVKAAGISVIRPMRGGISTSVYINGHTPAEGEEPHVSANLVTAGWMEAMGLRLMKGRLLQGADERAARVGVISETAARTFWPGRDPIGAQFKFDSDPKAAWYEVIGVVADARYGSVDADLQPFVYLSIFDPGLRSFRSQLHVFARTASDPVVMFPRIRDAAQAADAGVPLSFAMTLEEHVASVLMPQRLGLVLLLVFAAAGLILSAGGVYAIAAYHVSMRTREIGIRMALGAARLRVVGDILRDGAVPVAAGLAAGLAMQLWGAKFAESFVFDLDVRAPLTLLAAAGVVIAAAALALAIPARRAAGVDPAMALRDS